jgi:hypothetical protein
MDVVFAVDKVRQYLFVTPVWKAQRRPCIILGRTPTGVYHAIYSRSSTHDFTTVELSNLAVTIL